MPKSYTPNWFFTALLDNHINQLVARYSRLRALRMDFFYRKDTPDFLQPDHRWLELQLRMLLEQVEQFENIVGFFWVIEWTADHGFHALTVFALAFCHVATVFYQQVSVYRSTVVSGHRPSFCMLCPFYPAAALPVIY